METIQMQQTIQVISISDTDYTINEVKQIVYTIKEQLLQSAPSPYVVFSWGIHSLAATLIKEDDNEGMVALSFSVNALMHKGGVLIAYNECTDLYDIFLTEPFGRKKILKVIKKLEGVFFDTLATTIDSVVERDPSWDDAEYSNRIVTDASNTNK